MDEYLIRNDYMYTYKYIILQRISPYAMYYSFHN